MKVTVTDEYGTAYSIGDRMRNIRDGRFAYTRRITVFGTSANDTVGMVQLQIADYWQEFLTYRLEEMPDHWTHILAVP